MIQRDIIQHPLGCLVDVMLVLLVLHVLHMLVLLVMPFMNRHVLLKGGKHFILNVLLLAWRQLCTRDCPLKEVPSITEAEPSSNSFWTDIF